METSLRDKSILISVVVLSVATLAACGGGGHRSSKTGWADHAELVWIRRFGAWSRGFRAKDIRFDAAVRRVFRSSGTGSMPRLKRSAAGLSTCSSSFAAMVPPPPSTRLERASAGVDAACAAFGRVAHAIRTSRTAVVYGVVANSIVQTLRRARARLQSAAETAVVGLVAPRVRSSSATVSGDWIDPRLGQVATKLAGHRVAVRCWAAKDWRHLDVEKAALAGRRTMVGSAGWTPVGGARIDVRGGVCRRLDDLSVQPHSGLARAFSSADAVRILVHESEHAAGYDNEAITECVAIQRVAGAARQFGVTAAAARRLGRLVWRVYPLESSAYRTSACHDGGPYDLRPNDPAWP